MFFGKRPKILVVDDEPDIRQIIKLRLELRKYEVLTAADGQEAIATAQAAQPDLILMDVIMPGQNGYSVCRQLKDLESTKQIPVIFLTAKGRQDDIMQGTLVGAAAYLTKPFDTEQLLQTVEQALVDARDRRH